MDADGYPEEAELKAVREWRAEDFDGLWVYLRERWCSSGSMAESADKNGVWWCATGGWSGNESLIAALEENRLFWAFHWWSSRRGGRYEFKPLRKIAGEDA